MPMIFSEGGWAGRCHGNFLSLWREIFLEGGWTSWPTAWRCRRETGILPHYYFSWKDLTFYIQKLEDKWTPYWWNISRAHSFTSPDLLTSNYLTPWLMEPEVECRIHKGAPITPILSRSNPISRNGTLLLKVYSNIVLPTMTCLCKGLFPVGLPVKTLKALVPSIILSKWPADLNLLDLITLTILDEQ